MEKRRSLQSVQSLHEESIRAFRTWLSTLPKILAERVKPANLLRPEVAQFIEHSWHKLVQDFSATIALIESNHTGSAVAMTRICRENALHMLVLSFSASEGDLDNLSYLQNDRRRKNATLLKGSAEKLLVSHRSKLRPDVAARLDRAISAAGDVLNIETKPSSNTSAISGRGYGRLVELAIDKLTNDGFDPNLLAISVIDYWMECEAVHSGPDAHLMYEPHNFSNNTTYNELLTGLERLRDLHAVVLVATIAMLRSVNLIQTPQPPESLALLKIMARIEDFICK